MTDDEKKAVRRPDDPRAGTVWGMIQKLRGTVRLQLSSGQLSLTPKFIDFSSVISDRAGAVLQSFITVAPLIWSTRQSEFIESYGRVHENLCAQLDTIRSLWEEPSRWDRDFQEQGVPFARICTLYVLALDTVNDLLSEIGSALKADRWTGGLAEGEANQCPWTLVVEGPVKDRSRTSQEISMFAVKKLLDLLPKAREMGRLLEQLLQTIKRNRAKEKDRGA